MIASSVTFTACSGSYLRDVVQARTSPCRLMVRPLPPSVVGHVLVVSTAQLLMQYTQLVIHYLANLANLANTLHRVDHLLLRTVYNAIPGLTHLTQPPHHVLTAAKAILAQAWVRQILQTAHCVLTTHIAMRLVREGRLHALNVL